MSRLRLSRSRYHGNKNFLVSSYPSSGLFFHKHHLSSSLRFFCRIMFNFHPSSSASEKERLRALVGLDKTRMNSDFLLGTSASTANGNQTRTELPESPELVSLLQKQDQIITELYGELESCKNDLSLIKEQSAVQFEQNRRIFDELRAQIVKNNLGKDLVQPGQLVSSGVANGIVALHSRQVANFQQCSNCRELNELILKIEKEKQKLQSRLLDSEADQSNLRRQDAEYFRKVRESLALTDQAVLEKNETLVQLKHAQNRIETLEKELKNSLAEHQSSLDHYRKSAQQRYETEIEALKAQLNTVTKSELELKLRLGSITQERDDMTVEKATAKVRSSEKRRETDEKMKQLQSENTKLAKANKDLTEALKETEKATKLQTAELSEKVQNLEQHLLESRTSLDSSKSTLTVTKKENLELRERLAIAEKEIWHLRQWRQRLEREREEAVRSKDLELKEAVRIAELKHDQTKMELERLLTNQNGLIFKLKEECKMLADQLERVAKNRRTGRRTDGRSDGP